MEREKGGLDVQIRSRVLNIFTISISLSFDF